jgi:hypothetical protein
MEAGFIFIADRHPEIDGLTHFRDGPDQKPDSAPFDLKMALLSHGRAVVVPLAVLRS